MGVLHMTNGLPYTHINAELNRRVEEAMKLYESFLADVKDLGFDVRLAPNTKTLELYFHDDYPTLLLVDKYLSEQGAEEQ